MDEERAGVDDNPYMNNANIFTKSLEESSSMTLKKEGIVAEPLAIAKLRQFNSTKLQIENREKVKESR